MRTAVIVMSKVPRPGFTKTRLNSVLSERESAEFHRACLTDTCRSVRRSGMPGYIYYAEPLNNPQSEEKGSALDLWELPEEERIHFQMHPQQGEDLGERLYNAALEILTKYEAVLILGSDMPEITPDIILEAQERLFSSEIVIGPAHDGGYYLLGVKQAYPNIFCNIPWGTPQVLEKTLEIIRQNNLTFSLLQTHADIDNWDDLVNFFRIGKADENNRYESLAAFQIAVKLVEKYREGVRGWINT